MVVLHSSKLGTIYRTEYRLQNDSIFDFLWHEGVKRLASHSNRVDLTDLSTGNGVESHSTAYAIPDTRDGLLVVFDSSRNLFLIVTLIGPLFPVR
ncbi:MAG: hypothetical protein JWL59_1473 [Chthoniobacteraceae bacterium]|nr:hypothetical protein [Chthoniobacteraceae bacterium]